MTLMVIQGHLELCFSTKHIQFLISHPFYRSRVIYQLWNQRNGLIGEYSFNLCPSL